MLKILILCMLLSSWLLQAKEIRVAVAANVSYAIEDLKKAFYKTHPETKIQVILGSSGKLTAQIKYGAPYEMLLSADMKFPTRLYEEKLAITKPVIYAQGVLAILSVKERNYCAEMDVFKDADIEKVAIANPKTAPYGAAAKEALENARLYEKVKKKLVFAESAAQTLTYVRKAADIGIVAKSLLFTPELEHFKEAIHWSEVDERLYTPIDQGMVILKEGKDNTEVKAFYDFMLSAEAKKILVSFGYKVD